MLKTPLLVTRRITNRLRDIPGGVLLNDVLRRRFAKKGHKFTIQDFDNDISINLDLGDHMQSQIFWHGSYSREIIFLLKRLLKPGMTFVDAGANIGELSLIGAKLVGKTGEVHSFEPVARYADQLEANLALNPFANVRLHRVGLSDQPGDAPIFVASEYFADGTEHNGLATLYRSDERNLREQTITLTPLDEAIHPERLDVIKLDVEGAELAALKGASCQLERHHPDLIVEIGKETCEAAGYQGSDILDYLAPLGYKFYRIARLGKLIPIKSKDLTNFQNVYCRA